MSSSTVFVLIEILDDSLTTLVPRNHVTSGLGFALHLHFMVISVPLSFGMMRGFSTKDGAKPAPSSASWKDPRLDVAVGRRGAASGIRSRRSDRKRPDLTTTETNSIGDGSRGREIVLTTATPDDVSRVGSSMSYEAKIQRLSRLVS